MRYIKEKFFRYLMLSSLIVVFIFLCLIFGVILFKGGSVFIKNPEIVITPPGPRYLLGGEGGFLHAIIGSIYMVVPATIIASCLATGIAFYLQSDYSSKKTAEVIRTLLDALWGTPSIVYGIFVLSILIFLNQRACLLAGIFALSLLEFPIIARYIDEAIQSVPLEIRENSYSLGATRWEASKIAGKYVLPGIAAGVLIGVGRGIGDAASVIFTSGASSMMPTGFFQTATALPVMIFQQATSFYPSVREHAYAASFVLIVIVFILNLSSRLFASYFSKYVSQGG